MEKDIVNNFNTFIMPFQLGIYLAINAIQDAVLIVDGPNCLLPKAEFIYGNHDLNSTLLCPDGLNRIYYTMSNPHYQKGNPEIKLQALISVLANADKYGAVAITGQAYHSLSGIDYDGISSSVKGKIPVVSIPPKSIEYDWLEGYALTLKSIANALPADNVKKRKNTVVLAGCLFDRNEGDCNGNISEMKRLLKICGLDVICNFPGGSSFQELKSALDAEYVISMPYAREASEIIAKKGGSKLIEIGLPIGFSGTAEWVKQICHASGREMPDEIIKEKERYFRQYLKIGSILHHKSVIFAGDPYLFEAIASLCKEILMRPDTAVLDCLPRKMKFYSKNILFQPTTSEVRELVSKLTNFEKPSVIIGNSFALTEKFAKGIPFIELGFPSFSSHYLNETPFFGYAGVMNIISRLLNSQMSIVE